MLSLENITVGRMLRRTAEKYPDRDAIVYCGEIWTYSRLDADVDLLARRLLGMGIRKGAHVGLLCEAEPAAVIFMYACARIGAVACLLNTSLQRAELKDILERSDVTVLAIGDGYKELHYPSICRGLRQEVPMLEKIFYIGRAGRNEEYPVLNAADPVPEEMLHDAERAVDPQDTCFIIYTSGTTSAPKAVMGSHYSRANSAIQQANDLCAVKEDKFCVAMPVFHCFCLTVSVLAPCAVGACVVLPSSRRTEALLSAVSTYKCTVMSSVPALFHAILARPDLGAWDISSLRAGFIGGGMVSPEMFAAIEKGLGLTLLSSLGQSEATAGITTAGFDDPLLVRATTVGHFMDHVEGMIADPKTGEALPLNETGEICVRGYVVMQGYYGMPEATAQVIREDGWLRTGDLGFLDQDGNLHMTGRLKELIIRGGENISPAEIETAALENRSVKECKAIGVPDRHYGEEVCLCVVPKEGCSYTEAALRADLTLKLARYKVPRYIVEMRELPRTDNGKIRQARLRETAMKYLGL